MVSRRSTRSPSTSMTIRRWRPTTPIRCPAGTAPATSPPACGTTRRRSRCRSASCGRASMRLRSFRAQAALDSDPAGGFMVCRHLRLAADGGRRHLYLHAATAWAGVARTKAFTYTYRDGDGDLASAPLAITHRRRGASSWVRPLVAQLDDEIFAGGIAGGTGDANPNTANLAGNLAGSGGDGDLDYALHRREVRCRQASAPPRSILPGRSCRSRGWVWASS